ncbi:MAG: hypothetical protein RML12_00440 [Xanthomonadales bacterium]|nr:hypothetical protein [Xanthomonadales bacterium]
MRARLLARPLPEREAALAALIDLGLAQLDDPAVARPRRGGGDGGGGARPRPSGARGPGQCRAPPLPARAPGARGSRSAGDEEARLGHPAWLHLAASRRLG